MKKYLLLLICIVLFQNNVFSATYNVIYYSSPGGNPGGLNTETDDYLVGWTGVSTASQATNGLTNEITLPFSFYIISQVSNKIQISYNGLVYFKNEGGVTGSALGADNIALPTPASSGHPWGIFIACFWDKFASGGLGSNDRIYTKTFGTGNNRQFWIKWYDYKLNTSTNNYFACVLDEATKKVYMVDYGMSTYATTTTVGIQAFFGGIQSSSSPNISLTIGANNAVSNNRYYAFTPIVTDVLPIVTTVVDCGPSSLRVEYQDLLYDHIEYYWQGTDSTERLFDDPNVGYDPYYTYADGFYYLRAYDNVLKQWSNSATKSENLIYNPIPPAPSFSISPNLCGNKTLTLLNKYGADSVYWQPSSSSKLKIYDANYTTSAPTSGTYYIRSFKYGYPLDAMVGFECWSPMGSATVTVNPIPSTPPAPNITSANSCGAKTIEVASPPANTLYYWQTNNTGTSITNSSLSQLAESTGTYYSRARTNLGCWSANSSSISLSILTMPAKPTALISQNNCGNKTITMDSPPANTAFYWQTSNTGTSTSTVTNPRTVSATGFYYLRTRHTNACWSDAVEFDVAIYNYPSAPPLPSISANVCGDKTITKANPSSSNEEYYWQIDSAGESISNYNTSVLATKSGTLFLRSQTKVGGCWSNTTKLNVSVKNPYTNDPICIVTADMKTGQNLIVWSRSQNKNTKAYNIYKQGNIANQYVLIGQKVFADTSVFADVATSSQHAEYYKVTTVDSCDQEQNINSATSHKTLFLQQSSITAQGVNLIWFDYLVGTQPYAFNSYILYRGTDSLTLSAFDTIAGNLNQYTDTSAMAKNTLFFYRIVCLFSSPCSPLSLLKTNSGPFSQSISNLEDNRLKGSSISELKGLNELNIFPNPFSTTLNIQYDLIEESEVIITISDITGSLIREIIHEKQAPSLYTIPLDASSFSGKDGVYLINVIVNGQGTTKKLIRIHN